MTVKALKSPSYAFWTKSYCTLKISTEKYAFSEFKAFKDSLAYVCFHEKTFAVDRRTCLLMLFR